MIRDIRPHVWVTPEMEAFLEAESEISRTSIGGVIAALIAEKMKERVLESTGIDPIRLYDQLEGEVITATPLTFNESTGMGTAHIYTEKEVSYLKTGVVKDAVGLIVRVGV